MAGRAGRSGGANRVSIELHQVRGTFRPARHAGWLHPPEPAALSEADRERTLAGLPNGARQLAGQLLEEFTGWDASSLRTLRSYALACERLQALEATPGDDRRLLHREARTVVQLLRALISNDGSAAG